MTRMPAAELTPDAVTAVILAGGLGTRLRSQVADRPKALAPIAGRPFLAYLLDRLARAGLRQAVICTGHLGEQIERAFGSAYESLALVYSREPEPLGTGGALRLALPHLAGEACLVLNGDSYLAADLPAFIRWYAARPWEGALLLNWVEDTARFGTVAVDADDRVRSFQEKTGQAVPGWINAGIYLLAQRRVAALPAGRALSLEREVFPGWIAPGLGGCRVRADFIDIGTPDAFATAQAFFARPLAGTGPGRAGEKPNHE